MLRTGFAAHRHSLKREVPRSSHQFEVRSHHDPGTYPEQEEAEDQVEVTYTGDEVEIGFKVTYLLDALAAVETEKVILGLTDETAAAWYAHTGVANSKYVVYANAAVSRYRPSAPCHSPNCE